MPTIEEKKKIYQLAFALEVADKIRKSYSSRGTQDAGNALAVALEVLPIDWWAWELRDYDFANVSSFEHLKQKLRSFACGESDCEHEFYELTSEEIAATLDAWVDMQNDKGFFYGREEALVGRSQQKPGVYEIYTYDQGEDLMGIRRLILELN